MAMSIDDAAARDDAGVTTDATTDDGAAIDAASDASDSQKSWVPIETISVPVDGTTRTSTTVLQAGVTDHLRAQGTFVIQSPQGTLADAEYWDFSMQPPLDGVAGVDVGLAVNDPVADTTRTPKWGTYASSHVYEVAWVGNGAAIVAMLHDGNFTNNTGALTLQILAYQ
jgi:hypothetical protein